MQHDLDPQLTRDDTGRGEARNSPASAQGLALVPRGPVLAWRTEHSFHSRGRATISKGGGHWWTRLYPRLLKEQELDLRIREPELKTPAPPFTTCVNSRNQSFSVK